MLLGSDEKTYIVRTGDKLSDGTIRTITGGRDGDSAADATIPLSQQKQREVRKMLRHMMERTEGRIARHLHG